MLKTLTSVSQLASRTYVWIAKGELLLLGIVMVVVWVSLEVRVLVLEVSHGERWILRVRKEGAGGSEAKYVELSSGSPYTSTFKNQTPEVLDFLILIFQVQVLVKNLKEH